MSLPRGEALLVHQWRPSDDGSADHMLRHECERRVRDRAAVPKRAHSAARRTGHGRNLRTVSSWRVVHQKVDGYVGSRKCVVSHR